MTSSVQSHLPSARCLPARQCPLQAHFPSEYLHHQVVFGPGRLRKRLSIRSAYDATLELVVAEGEISCWSHICPRFLDVSAPPSLPNCIMDVSGGSACAKDNDILLSVEAGDGWRWHGEWERLEEMRIASLRKATCTHSILVAACTDTARHHTTPQLHK